MPIPVNLGLDSAGDTVPGIGDDFMADFRPDGMYGVDDMAELDCRSSVGRTFSFSSTGVDTSFRTFGLGCVVSGGGESS